MTQDPLVGVAASRPVAAEGRAGEPPQLLRGKAFHRRVQEDWTRTGEGQGTRVEWLISLGLAPSGGKRIRKGRIDIFLDQMEDFVSIVELKATDWDLVKVANRRKLLSSHVRQVMKYVDKYLDQEKVNVCAGIIYPRPPASAELRAEVEQFLNDNALQVVWFDEA